ncbi:Pyruvate carboxylase [Geoglobus ahangari]|uniref:Pyruvate carboxylase n=1 Tax=Geoglobus ahangari TaxID=113653 RepID=A0A0F7IDZ6_9EURY|nr:biotin/lipoyl-containing protein [Geoglobus ahangari]AKG91128.1 Pyruvate carboxylase [Geoglobus ahangari]
MVRYSVIVNGKRFDVEVEELSSNRFKVVVNGKEEEIELFEERRAVEAKEKVEAPVSAGKAEGGEVKAEMSGSVVRILVKEGEAVKKGQPVLILEAMKMENEVVSPADGIVESIEVREGDKVQAGDVLIRIRAEGGGSPAEKPKAVEGDGTQVKAEMAGTIVRIVKKEGEAVKSGEAVVILEAMKMENEISSPVDGVVSKVYVKEGDKVQAGDVLFSVS